MKGLLWIVWLLWLPVCGFGQEDFSWWNQKHHWNGVTPWSRYLIYAPGFFGPNALPVPELQKGSMDTTMVLELGGEAHFSAGDKTQNLQVHVFVPLFSDRVGIDLRMVPFEHYRMDTTTRDERRARDFDGMGTAVGDLYIGTFIQLLQENDRRPGLLLTANMRTASGNRLTAARFTDRPGYFFDLSIGKTLAPGHSFLQRLRPYAMAGFYVYQSESLEQEQAQNDCFMFGAGLDLDLPGFRLRQQVTGYLGYLGNRDKPVVYRARLQTTFPSAFNAWMGIQTGIHQWAYTTFQLTAVYRLDMGRS